MVECRMTVTELAPGAPRSVALDYKGGALATNFSGTALNTLAMPVGSTVGQYSTSAEPQKSLHSSPSTKSLTTKTLIVV